MDGKDSCVHTTLPLDSVLTCICRVCILTI